MVLREPLWIEHCHLCMKGRLKLRWQSPFMEYCLRMLLINFVIFRFWRRYTHISPLLWIVGLTGTGIGYSPLAEIIYWSYSISGSFSYPHLPLYWISGSFFTHPPPLPSIRDREASPPVLRIRIHWIRKILASWIRIRIRIQRAKYHQKL